MDHNKVPHAEGLYNGNAPSHSAGDWDSEIKVLARQVSREALLLGLQMASSPCVFTSSSFCICLSLFSASDRDTCYLGLGPVLMSSF